MHTCKLHKLTGLVALTAAHEAVRHHNSEPEMQSEADANDSDRVTISIPNYIYSLPSLHRNLDHTKDISMFHLIYLSHLSNGENMYIQKTPRQ